ncbi:hypothetical protein [Propionivibrio sp.]|uniref:hypothetical protein n=1 Tax=Propionivibrio sp. TaxID=2212460 RepID=UPI003BF06C70
MTISTCPTCGSKYQKDEPWKKTCLKCWQRKKRAEEGSSSGTSSELPNHSEDVLRLQIEVFILRTVKPVGIEPDMLSRLVRLCHPDRHGNSEGSTKATAWLLEQRA